MAADGSIVIVADIDDKKAQAELNRLSRKIQNINDQIEGKTRKRSYYEAQAEQLRQAYDTAIANDQDDLAQNLAKQYDKVQAAITRINEQLRLHNIDLGLAQEKAGVYAAQLSSVGEAGVTSGEETSFAMEDAEGAIEEVGEAGEEAGEKTAEGFNFANSAAGRLERRIVGLIRRVFIFSVITSALRGLRAWLVEVVKSDNEAAAAMAQLKGALLTLAQPIVEIIIPAFIALVNVLTRVVTAIASLVSRLFGKTLQQSTDSAEALYAEQNAIEGVGSAAKDASKSLAAFDEINQLSDDSGSGGGFGGGGGASGAEIKPDFSFADDIKDKISELEIYVSGALLAVGAILTFSGINIPLGIALMAAGAIGLVSVIAENWNSMPENIKTALTNVAVMLGSALLAIGAILVFSGANVPLGIGLMVAGAASLAAAVALNWDSVNGKIKESLTKLLPIIAGATLVLGAILAFSGVNLPLGIALMAVGAAGLAASIVLNWETVKTALQGPMGRIVTMVSEALLVLGAILTFSGANLPLGIALMAAGAVGLVTMAVLNWETIKTTLQGPIGRTMALASAAVLAMGAILAFSGVNLPLGIALMAAGAVGLVTVTALNWNAIGDKLRTVWDGIKQWFNTQVAPKLTIAYWQAKFTTIGDALKNGIKSGINAAIVLFNRFVDWINDKMDISWSAKSILGQEVIPAGSIQLFHLNSIPMLAQGAVIPPNREFLAVLGDQSSGNNIEAPESLLRQMAQEAASANTALLEQILQAIRDGKVIAVDRTILGKTAKNSMYDLARMGY